jgi:hypothetical protein
MNSHGHASPVVARPLRGALPNTRLDRTTFAFAIVAAQA